MNYFFFYDIYTLWELPVRTATFWELCKQLWRPSPCFDNLSVFIAYRMTNTSLLLVIYKRKVNVWHPQNVFCHWYRNAVSYPHILVSICRWLQVCTNYNMTKGDSHHLCPTILMSWAADFGIPPSWQKEYILHHVIDGLPCNLSWLAPIAPDTTTVWTAPASTADFKALYG